MSIVILSCYPNEDENKASKCNSSVMGWGMPEMSVMTNNFCSLNVEGKYESRYKGTLN
jgi:hypothetical protein